jgi:exonuclease III
MDHENVSKWIRQPLPMTDQEQQKFDALAKRLQEVKKELALLKDRKKQGNQSATVVSSQEVSGVVVDDRKAKKIGSWKESNSVKVYIDEGYLHDENKDRGSKSVTFDPGSLASGLYTVRMSYAHGENRSSKTQVRVFNADGETLVVVNQKTPPAEDGLWFNLGKYRFEKDGAAFVIVSNEQADGHVIADSVQFMPELEDSSKKEPQAESKSSAQNVDEQQESMIKQIAILEKLQTEIQKELDLRPMAQTLRPAESPSDIPIHVRGSVHRLGPVVERGFLSCINSHEPELNRRIRVQATDNGRLELAQWTIAPENPLTARVYVNRIWYQMMGRGIVPTVDNFGTTGSPPSDPQLLDWLASEFIAQDWSTKWLVRTIATSKAYRRSIAASPDSLEKDPENQVFARGLMRRLDSESLRDSMLQASGELKVGGSVGSTISLRASGRLAFGLFTLVSKCPPTPDPRIRWSQSKFLDLRAKPQHGGHPSPGDDESSMGSATRLGAGRLAKST